VRESFLRLQIFADRHSAPNLAGVGNNALLGFEDRKQSGLDRQPRKANGVVRCRAPAERTRHVDMDVACAVNAHRLDDLALQVVEVGDRCSRDIGNAVGHRDLRHALAGAEHVAGLRSHRRRGGGAGGGRRRRRALHTGIHVGFVIVADVEHIIVALEHSRETAEADVRRSTVAALRNGSHFGVSLDAHRCRNAGGNRGGVAEQRMQPGDLPGGLGVRRCEYFEATRCIDRDELAGSRSHGGIDGVARAERLAAALAGAMAAGQRIRTVE
jgi:hypothetical protein